VWYDQKSESYCLATRECFLVGTSGNLTVIVLLPRGVFLTVRVKLQALLTLVHARPEEVLHEAERLPVLL
jgi:hypothetical protein